MANISWEKQWLSFPVIQDKPCRGCLHLSSVHRSGNIHVIIRKLALSKEVRDTDAGRYCKDCFVELPTCPICNKEPVSHSEYPCLKCELNRDITMFCISGGRSESPTYRGWTPRYVGKDSDYCRSRSRRKACQN
jgi:hypothetical protein